MGDRISVLASSEILLPHTDLGIHIAEPDDCRLVADALTNGRSFGLTLAEPIEGRDEPRYHPVGTLAHIAGYARLADGRFLLELEGVRRFAIHSTSREDYLMADVGWLTEEIGNFRRAREASALAEHRFHAYRAANGDADLPIRLPVDPIARSYVITAHLNLPAEDKQSLLELPSAAERLGEIAELLGAPQPASDPLTSRS